MWIGREVVQSVGRLAVEIGTKVDAIGAKTEALRLNLAELSADYVKCRAELAASQAQLGQLQSSFSWLTEHVNRLERERAELLARVLAVNFPAMRLDRVEASDAPTPGQSRILGRPAEDDYAGTIPALQAVGALFEDVGDEHASALGAKHDDMGNVIWTK